MIDSKKISIREFYLDLVKDLDDGGSYVEFMPESRIAHLYIEWDLESRDISVDEMFKRDIKRPDGTIPSSVKKSYERHFWYSRHNITDITVLKLSVDGENTYGLLFQGHMNDGWDNAGTLIEVYSEQGELVGSGSFYFCEETRGNAIKWSDERLCGKSYMTPAPPWPLDPSEEKYDVYQRVPIWSEKS